MNLSVKSFIILISWLKTQSLTVVPRIYVQPYSYILNDMLYEQPPESSAYILPYGHDLNVFQTTFLDGTASDLGIQFQPLVMTSFAPDGFIISQYPVAG